MGKGGGGLPFHIQEDHTNEAQPEKGTQGTTRYIIIIYIYLNEVHHKKSKKTTEREIIYKKTKQSELQERS